MFPVTGILLLHQGTPLFLDSFKQFQIPQDFQRLVGLRIYLCDVHHISELCWLAAYVGEKGWSREDYMIAGALEAISNSS